MYIENRTYINLFIIFYILQDSARKIKKIINVLENFYY